METKNGALLVPQRAVTEMQGKFLVAVVGADNTVEIRTVVPAQRIGSLWIIDKGLKPARRWWPRGYRKSGPGSASTDALRRRGAAKPSGPRPPPPAALPKGGKR